MLSRILYITYSPTATRKWPPIIIFLIVLIVLHTHTAFGSNIPAGIYEHHLASPVVEPQPSGEQKCQKVDSYFCNIDNYLTVQPFKNTLGHGSLKDAIADLHKFVFLLQREPCKSKIQLFLCSLYAPVCVTSTVLDKFLLPCRDGCEEARRACSADLTLSKEDWPEEWDCAKFNYHRDDQMCVINNSQNQTSSRQQQPTLNSPIDQDQTFAKIDDPLVESKSITALQPATVDAPRENETICAEDLFDCRLRDPHRNMNAFCIDPRWVCDGKRDCVVNGIDDGLDEIGCESRCSEGQHYCDGKCLSRSDICNGKVDCSSGSDEQDCYDYLTGLIQSVLCIFALFSSIYLLVRFFRIDDSKVIEDRFDKSHYESTDKNQPCQSGGTNARVLDEETNQNSPHFVYQDQAPRFPIYQEPAYSILTRSDYERLNIGGRSGCSSVYASYGAYHPHPIDTPSILPAPTAPPPIAPRHSRSSSPMLGDPPAAPPPTPNLHEMDDE